MSGATREEFISTGPGAPPADLHSMSAEQRGRYNFESMLRACLPASVRVAAAKRVQAG
jgi:hypothetical protein